MANINLFGTFDGNQTVQQVRLAIGQNPEIVGALRKELKDDNLCYAFDAIVALIMFARTKQETDSKVDQWDGSAYNDGFGTQSLIYHRFIEVSNLTGNIIHGFGNAGSHTAPEDYSRCTNTTIKGVMTNVLAALAHNIAKNSAYEIATITLAELYQAIDNDPSSNRDVVFRDGGTGTAAQKKQLMLQILENKLQTNLVMETDAAGEIAESAVMQTLQGMIRNGGIRQIILTGAPGTGKTRMARMLAESMGSTLPNNKKYQLVQFHPSYDYTDFIEGLRPVNINGSMQFVKMDGSFKRFCRVAANETMQPVDENRMFYQNKLYFFIIDEINRADLSKVFGELMFCLEKDKRGPDHAVVTQYHQLVTHHENGDQMQNDVFREAFYIPENVVIIGTMNDIDRSVESMDFALRRRFEWVEVDVTTTMISAALNGMIRAHIQNHSDIGSFPNLSANIRMLAAQLANRVTALNGVIADEDGGAKYGLNKHYFISQGQFANLPDTLWEDAEAQLAADSSAAVRMILRYVWKFRIHSLLREYVRGEDEKNINELMKKCEGAFLYDKED